MVIDLVSSQPLLLSCILAKCGGAVLKHFLNPPDKSRSHALGQYMLSATFVKRSHSPPQFNRRLG
ncbi:MAG: hypothetical protein F6K26_25335 [Moorea sp. SIO2I5]|nr:hypothetical protein [Moorena sp. SIO2I5]